MDPKLPNLLIAGTQKGGTTWLHAQLARHPDVFMSHVKEIGYLHNRDGRIDGYARHFESASGERWRGESTPHYFWARDSRSPYSIGRDIDTADFAATQLGRELTVIVSLRDPVSRAISGYFHHIGMGRLKPEQSIFRCPMELGIVDLGFYRRHWNKWAGVFGAERVRAVLFDDLVADADVYTTQVCSILEIDPEGLGKLDREHIGERPGIVRLKKERNPIVPAEVGALLEIYKGEIEFIEELLNRDLSGWRDLDRLVAKHCS